jgi:flavin reductase (DIM6/NTAB) family NADH-FMN oxidoreductase RutF
MVPDVSVSNSGAALLVKIKCTVLTTVNIPDHALAFCRVTYCGHAEPGT